MNTATESKLILKFNRFLADELSSEAYQLTQSDEMTKEIVDVCRRFCAQVFKDRPDFAALRQELRAIKDACSGLDCAAENTLNEIARLSEG